MKTLAIFGLPEFVALFIFAVAYTLDITKMKPATWSAEVRNTKPSL